MVLFLVWLKACSLLHTHKHTHNLGVLGASDDSAEGWYNGRVFENLLQLGCSLEED